MNSVKNLMRKLKNMPLLTSEGKARRRRAATMSDSEIIMFCLTGANVDDRDPKVWAVLGRRIYGKLFADRGYISPNLFDALFADGIHLVTGIRSNMKNRLMPLWDKIMPRKRQ